MFKKTLLSMIFLSSLTNTFLSAKSDEDKCYDDCEKIADKCYDECRDIWERCQESCGGNSQCLTECGRGENGYSNCWHACRDEIDYPCQRECLRRFPLPRKNENTKDENVDIDEGEQVEDNNTENEEKQKEKEEKNEPEYTENN